MFIVAASSNHRHSASISLNKSLKIITVLNFYRAMHYSAKRGLAIARRPSVCPSVCPSVTLVI